MSLFRLLLNKIGLAKPIAEHYPLYIFLLDDDARRHEWFTRRFPKDYVDIAETPAEAIELLKRNQYDVLFLDHDLLPEHYKSELGDDDNTGYAVALWLAANPRCQASANIIAHTRNADGAMRIVDSTLR